MLSVTLEILHACVLKTFAFDLHLPSIGRTCYSFFCSSGPQQSVYWMNPTQLCGFELDYSCDARSGLTGPTSNDQVSKRIFTFKILNRAKLTISNIHHSSCAQNSTRTEYYHNFPFVYVTTIKTQYFYFAIDVKAMPSDSEPLRPLCVSPSSPFEVSTLQFFPNPWKPSSWFSRHLEQDQWYQEFWIFPQASPWLAFDRSPHSLPQKGVFRRAQWLGDRVEVQAGLMVSWG